jgi:son of sevenless
LYILKNYASLFSILGALTSNPIFRLKKTWEGLSYKYLEKYEEVSKLTNFESNSKSYRIELKKNVGVNCIPHISVYLSDLSLIIETTPDFLSSGLINFQKRRYIYEVKIFFKKKVIKNIKSFQKSKYEILVKTKFDK